MVVDFNAPEVQLPTTRGLLLGLGRVWKPSSSPLVVGCCWASRPGLPLPLEV